MTRHPLKPLVICTLVCLCAPGAKKKKKILLQHCLVSSAALENKSNIPQSKGGSLTKVSGMSLPALLPKLGTPVLMEPSWTQKLTGQTFKGNFTEESSLHSVTFQLSSLQG